MADPYDTPQAFGGDYTLNGACRYLERRYGIKKIGQELIDHYFDGEIAIVEARADGTFSPADRLELAFFRDCLDDRRPSRQGDYFQPRIEVAELERFAATLTKSKSKKGLSRKEEIKLVSATARDRRFGVRVRPHKKTEQRNARHRRSHRKNVWPGDGRWHDPEFVTPRCG